MRSRSLLTIFALLLISYASEGKDPSVIEVLMKAVEEGSVSRIQDALQKDVSQEDLNTSLIFAVRFGREAIVRELLNAGADANARDQSNNASALMWASIVDPGKDAKKKGIALPAPESKIEIVKQLLAAKADVNIQNAWGGTALQWAADSGQVEIVRLLMKAGAEVNRPDNDGLSPLMSAANYDSPAHQQILQLLLDAKADFRAVNKNGESALFYAMNNLKTENTTLLLKAGADVNGKNNSGMTPLMRASQMSRVDIMAILIKNGADINARNENGESVLAIAKKAGYKQAISVLVKAGAHD